jgi:iron complex outermembrane receptor protein
MVAVLCTPVYAATINGTVVNTDGKPIISANITTNVGGIGTVSGDNGRFSLTYSRDVVWVTFSSVGYQSRQFKIDQVPDTVILDYRYYEGSNIVVRGDRAEIGIDPIAFSNFTEEEIDRDYTVGEFPLLLETTPNLHTFTDGGAALGYSYVRIRGFDDKRIATYINGVPLNDPEDQATYFVDLPDFASNITDIQVQRGVGNSLYGAASFGGAMNIVSSAFGRERHVSVESGYGIYSSDNNFASDIYKQSIDYTSGLIDGRWAFTGRFSKQKTGGYRYNSWYDGWAYYLAAARLDPNMSTELHIYGGPIRMHLAYWGISPEVLAQDRRSNPLSYDNETDNFNQPHYHLHNTYRINDQMTLSNTFYYIRGKGYYEQLKNLESYDDFREYGLDTAMVAVDNPDLVRQQWVAKNQYGWNPRLDITHDRGRHSFGGSFYYFESDHWGQVVWVDGITDPAQAPRQRYYEYFGEKIEANAFAQEYYKVTDRLSAQATALVRYQRYNFDQTRMNAFRGYNYSTDWLFFSPRLGITFNANRNLSLYTSFAISSRTPTDATIYDANDPFIVPSLEVKSVNADSTEWEFGDPTADAERIYDLELGGDYRTERYSLGLNLYWMKFSNEIIPWGAVDDDGLRRSVNADRSLHAGIEFSGAVEPTDRLRLDGNFSYNYNRLRDYVGDVDGFPVDFSDNTVPGFPEYLGNAIATYDYGIARLTWRNQFVGKQYMDFANTEEFNIDPYYTSSASLEISFHGPFDVGRLTIGGHVYNLFNAKYETSGYGGNYAYLDEAARLIVGSWAEYYPAPERWFFTQMKLDLF